MHIDSTLLINSKIYQKYNNLTKKTHISLSWTQAKIDCHRFQRRIPSISPTSHKPFSDRWSVRPVGFKIVSRYSWSIETIAATSTRRGVAHNFVAFPTDTRPYQSSEPDTHRRMDTWKYAEREQVASDKEAPLNGKTGTFATRTMRSNRCHD